jgi:hypothetical protein
MNQKLVSISPSGEEFPLPSREDYSAEFKRLKLGCEVKGMGRGHIKRLKESLKL